MNDEPEGVKVGCVLVEQAGITAYAVYDCDGSMSIGPSKKTPSIDVDADEVVGAFPFPNERTPRRDYDEFLTAVREGSYPTTDDVAETLDYTYKTAYYRLTELEDQGKVSSHTTSDDSVVWRVTNE